MKTRVRKLIGLILYGSFWLLGAVLIRIPFVLKRCFAVGFSYLWFWVLPFRRLVVLHNLKTVFGNDRKKIESLSRQHMAHIVLTLFEIFERFHWNDRFFATRVRIHGREHFEDAQKKSAGYFILTAHLGNWELMTRAGAFLPVKPAIVTRFLRNSLFDELWVRSRRSYKLRLLPESGSGLQIVRAIREGFVVGFILDQHTGEPHGIQAQFFDKPAMCPKGLAILSHRLKVPVLPCYFVRGKDGHYDMNFDAVLEFPELANRQRGGSENASGNLSDAEILYHIGICNENMERWIRRYPEQYLWLHRRFKNWLDYRQPIVWD